MRNTLYVLLLTIVFSACKKPEKDPDPINIEGFQLIDAVGNFMGRVGPADNDWQLVQFSTLNTLEQSLLNSTDTTNTNNTSLATVNFMAYPNPTRDISALSISA